MSFTACVGRYFTGFKQSVYHSKHQIDVLTGSMIYLSDVLYDDTAFSYFTEVTRLPFGLKGFFFFWMLDKFHFAGARFSKSLTTNLRKTYEQVWLTKNLGWACDCQKSYEKLRTKLCKTYEKLNDDVTGILRKRKIRDKWCHSGNPLSEAVIGRIFWAKNNWQPGCFRIMSYHFSKKILGSRISLTYKNLWKYYDELKKNLTKFRKSGPRTCMGSLWIKQLKVLKINNYFNKKVLVFTVDDSEIWRTYETAKLRMPV